MVIYPPQLLISVPLALGVLCIWLARLLRIPMALAVLLGGVALQWAAPLLRNNLEMEISLLGLGLSLVFFEGGKRMGSLPLGEDASLVRHLVALGAKLSWLAMAFLAHFVAGLSTETALLVGALLMVMAPYTVEGHVQSLGGTPRWTRILAWETQTLTCLGAAWAVLVGAGLAANQGGEPSIMMILKTTLYLAGVGAAVGFAIFGLCRLIQAHVPPDLSELLCLSMILLGSSLSHQLAFGSGLVAASLIGYLYARLGEVSTADLGTSLHLLVLALIGIYTGAMASVHVLDNWVRDLGFALVLVCILRPALIWLACGRNASVGPRTLRGLTLIQPRGLLTLAVCACVGHGLDQIQHPEALRIAPLAFWVVVVTQAVPWLLGGTLLRGLTDPEPEAVGADEVSAGHNEQPIEVGNQ